MKVEEAVRKMARSAYWQRIYRSSKKLSNISLFINVNNFSGLQYLFLHWLEIYDILYQEYYNKEWDILDEELINDDIHCDAFLYWRKREQDIKISENKKEMKKNKFKTKSKGKNQKNFRLFNGPKNKVTK